MTEPVALPVMGVAQTQSWHREMEQFTNGLRLSGQSPPIAAAIKAAPQT